MAGPVTRPQVLSIYKQLLRESQKFESYNFRCVSLRLVVFRIIGWSGFFYWDCLVDLQELCTTANSGHIQRKQAFDQAGWTPKAVQISRGKFRYDPSTGEDSWLEEWIGVPHRVQLDKTTSTLLRQEIDIFLRSLQTIIGKMYSSDKLVIETQPAK